MFTIIKVKLSNFRSHKEFTFEPKKEGVTAISGANGSGKSTIVDSIAWALYGVKPSGVSTNAKFIREGSEPQDKTFVEVTLKIDKDIVKIVRKIINKKGSVECEVYSYDNDKGEYVLEAGPAVTHADPYIRKRLKMDSKGFLASILVQQKQVDNLISSGARERAQVIEKLTGISSITEALDRARKEELSLKKAIKLFHYDPKVLKNLEKEQKTLQKTVDSLNKKIVTKEEEYDILKEDYDNNKIELENIEKIYNEELYITETIDKNNTIINITRDELERVIKQKDTKKKQLPTSSIRDIKKVAEDLNIVKNNLDSATITLSKINDNIEDLNNENIQHESIIKKYGNVDNIKENIQNIEQKILLKEKNIKNIENEIQSYKTIIQQTQNAINIINTGDECPTCLQKVEEISKVSKTLQNSISEAEDKIKELNANKIVEKEELDELVEENSFSIQVNEAIYNLDKNKNTLVKRGEQKKKADKAIISLRSDLDLLTKEYSKTEQYDSIKKEYDEILELSVQLSDKIEKAEKENALLSNKRISTKVTMQQLTKLREKIDKQNTVIQEVFSVLSELKQEHKVAESRLGYVKENIVKNNEEAERYSNMLEAVEIASSTTSVIQDFKEDRIRNSIPVVETYASNFFNKFTEGKFTGIKLDKNFNATVILANGNSRPVGLLSGGELSASALSLRLAISMLLNNNSENSTIILDEVLVSQDDVRSELILSVIKDSINGQVIMISHGATTSSIADSIVEL